MLKNLLKIPRKKLNKYYFYGNPTMRLAPLFTCCFFCLGSLSSFDCQAQSTDSLKNRMLQLLRARREHVLNDTGYLRGIDSLAPLMEGEDSLPDWLSVYRDIVFADPRMGRRRASYYTYLALNAYNTSKLGSVVYYSEKNNEERIRTGLFEKGKLSHSDLFALSLYYNNRDYRRVTARLNVMYPVLTAMPDSIATGSVSPEQAFLALSLLETAVYTWCRTGDTARMSAAYHTSTEILRQIERQPARFLSFTPQYAYLGDATAFEVNRCSGKPAEASYSLEAAIGDALAPRFPANLRSDYVSSLYTEAVDFYFDRGQPDSARHYLDLLGNQGPNCRFSAADPVFLLTGEGRLLADKGDYAGAYQRVRKAYLLRDSAYYAVSSDRDNNLYALAEADNAHAELIRSEENRRLTERSRLLLFFLLFLLLAGGSVLFLVYRGRQRRRLSDLQLQLARDFHDAIGPMLSYANVLAKKELDDRPSQRLSELKDQIGQSMEAVRSISHDLKTKRLKSIDDLGHEVQDLLEKVRRATGIDFRLQVDKGDRVLSHFQFSALSKIIQEMVGNSVKHAGCNNIELNIDGINGLLRLRYSDDGVGIDPGTPLVGIGLQNIRDRVASLKGRFQLDNSFPGSYSVHISIPLV